VGQFEFLASCVTTKKIQTDPLPGEEQAPAKLNGWAECARNVRRTRAEAKERSGHEYKESLTQQRGGDF
jgi:hypothetical protein